MGLDAKNALKRNTAIGITNVKDMLSTTTNAETDTVNADVSKVYFVLLICSNIEDIVLNCFNIIFLLVLFPINHFL